MRRDDDAFHYAAVHVGSFEDALLAMMVNDNLQAVVLIDGFQFASRHDIPDLHEFLARTSRSTPRASRPARWRPRWRAPSSHIRPELDLYLLSDRAPESLAGSDEAEPIRRLFHHVEEPMEIAPVDPRRHQGPLTRRRTSTT